MSDLSRIVTLACILLAGFGLSGCVSTVVGATVGATAAVAGAAVSTTGKVAVGTVKTTGKVVGAAIPDRDDKKKRNRDRTDD